MIGPRLPYPDTCLPELVAQQARWRPDSIALIQGDRRLSYAELVSSAAGVAAALRERGVGVDSLVGVCLDRRPELVVAMLGILAAGAGYVPLDPSLPAQRLKSIVDEARLTLIVGDRPFDGIDVVAVSGQRQPVQPSGARPDSTAYAMFTSGSTGRPKGVVIEHRALTELVTSAADFAGLTPESRCLAFASIGFDACVIDLLAPLAAGATVVLASDAERADPTRLHRVCADNSVDVVVLPPPVLPIVEPAYLTDLRLVITGGEASPPEQVARWTAGGREFINVYGPTEATVLVTWFSASGEWRTPLPIGRPAANHRIYLLDDQLREVATGEVGELFTGGPGLGRGYLNEPAATAASFVPDPFAGTVGARLYRTGDLARCAADGALEFLGRADRQVKVRGQRIELGEIETVLRRHAGVAAGVVEVRPGAAGAQLVAYVVSEESERRLREQCARWLPAAAVPTRIYTFGRLPMTINGKTDLERLRALVTAREAGLDAPMGSSASEDRRYDGRAGAGDVGDVGEGGEGGALAAWSPATQAEAQLAEVWAELLERPALAADADFFDHGGHSLIAMRLVTQLRRRLSRSVEIEDVLAGRTLGGIAARAAAAPPTQPDVAARGRPPALSPAQQRLWFLDKYSLAASAAYNVAFAERLIGPLDVAAFAKALSMVVARQQILRWRIPDLDGAPYAVVDPVEPVELSVTKLTAGTDLSSHLAAAVARPFVLATDRLWRAELIELGSDEHVFAFYAHHAVFDGWSQSLFYVDLAAAYQAALGAGQQLPPLPATYGDYVAWRAERVVRRGEGDLRWWLEHLTGVPVLLQLPTGQSRPDEQTFASAMVTCQLDAAGTAAMSAFAAGLGTTPSAVLLAAFGLVLADLAGQDDLVVGTPTVDRRSADFEQMVGFFIDIAPLRLRLTPEAGFCAHVRAARDELLSALAHPEAPVERIVGAFGLGGRLDRSPLVQILFNMYTFAEPRLELTGVVSEPVPIAAPGSPFDLTLYGVARGERLRIEIVYNPDVYDAPLMRSLLDGVARLLQAGVAQPDRPVRDLFGEAGLGLASAGQALARRASAMSAPVERARRATPALNRSGAIAQRPATATQRRIASVWCDVLGLAEVGSTDSFFDIGGGSLAVALVARQLNRLLGTELRVVDLFRYPTVRALAAYLESIADTSAGAAAEEDAAVERAARRGAARRERAGRRSEGVT